jgi:L-asparagine oxygenase
MPDTMTSPYEPIAASTRSSGVTLSLSPMEMTRISSAAAKCVSAGIVTNPEEFVIRTQRHVTCLPMSLIESLRAFRRYGSPTGGFLVRGCPVFEVPATPEDPAAAVGTTLQAAGVLGIITAVLGDQYGFKPEMSGHLIQDIVPVAGFEQTQQSISSEADLYMHVESAFTDDRPDYVALFCLRADHDHVAGTTLSSVEAMLPRLSERAAEVLRQPRFKTTVDASFLQGIGNSEPIYVGPIQVLTGSTSRPRIRADFAETTGLDAAAQAALDELRECAIDATVGIRLKPGDLLFVDNHRAFHGRTPFRARWDGADRWLLRTFVTKDLSRSEAHRPGDGRIVDADYSTEALV